MSLANFISEEEKQALELLLEARDRIHELELEKELMTVKLRKLQRMTQITREIVNE